MVDVKRLSSQSSARRYAARRRGLILPVMLVILLLLALMSATFAFRIQAENNATVAMQERVQCRLAAEAGIERVKLMLRAERDNPDMWYDNPVDFDQALMWSPDANLEEIGRGQTVNELDTDYAYRFSIVADDPFDDEENIRFGITDEASKININYASEAQLLALISSSVPADVEPIALVHALLDWRDADDEPREFGAEKEYYQSLTTPYRCKNAPFETVEELLMVKGFTGQILYGEDYDRNGLMTPNEDDGELSFPFDDGDGLLNRGLLPYLTVYSQEFNTANDNKPRINVFRNGGADRAKLEETFDDDALVDFIIDATRTEGIDKMSSLADYLEPRMVHNALKPSPFQGNLAAKFFDKCTTTDEPQFFGRINVVTAPPKVLRCIDGLPEEAIPLIVQKRPSLSTAMKSSTAWLVTEKILTVGQYAAIADQITGRSRQFTVESIGFADHSGMYVRLQAVLAMRGPMAQVVYNRDLTRLGLSYPIRGEEGDRDIVRRTE